MPQRILRDWTDSFQIDLLTFEEEVLFTRLIMKADDYGNFHRNPKMIKSLLFPLKDGLRVSDIDRWLMNLQAAGIIRTYTHKGSPYLNIVNFGQRLRQHKRTYPEPVDFDNTIETCQQVVSELPSSGEPEEKRREEEGKRREGFAPPSLEDVREYFTSKGYASGAADKAFAYYNEAGWRDSKGNKVKNWKQKMISVWFKEENKIKTKGRISQFEQNEW